MKFSRKKINTICVVSTLHASNLQAQRWPILRPVYVRHWLFYKTLYQLMCYWRIHGNFRQYQYSTGSILPMRGNMLFKFEYASDMVKLIKIPVAVKEDTSHCVRLLCTPAALHKGSLRQIICNGNLRSTFICIFYLYPGQIWNHGSLLSWWQQISTYIWPLSLTWINFNPSMDK